MKTSFMVSIVTVPRDFCADRPHGKHTGANLRVELLHRDRKLNIDSNSHHTKMHHLKEKF